MIRRFLERRRFLRDHRFAHARLSDYIEQELPPSEHRRVEEHVGICPQCRRVLATLKRTLRDLRSLPAESRPGVADAVIDRLRKS
jgi:anti-sigma factor RsiW